MLEMQQISDRNFCPSPDISSYIDGELTARQEIELEMHLSGCRLCTDELNDQKKLLCVLDANFDKAGGIELPENFTKIVVTNAESRVSGLRRASERFNAAFVCCGLFLFIMIAMGADSGNMLAAVVSVFEKFMAVGAFAAHIAYNIGIGAVIILRSLSSQLLFGTSAYVLYPGLLGAYVFIISRIAGFLNRG